MENLEAFTCTLFNENMCHERISPSSVFDYNQPILDTSPNKRALVRKCPNTCIVSCQDAKYLIVPFGKKRLANHT